MSNSLQPDAPQPKSKLDGNHIFTVFVLVFVDVLGLTVILPLLHLYAAAYGASALEIGLVAAAFPIAQLIGVPLMGSLSDRFGRKPLLLISQISTFVAFLILGFSNSLGMIIFSRLLDGLFGANIATAQAALSDLSTDENRTQALGLTGAAFGLGFIFGPLISIISLSLSDSLAVPAFTAAAYSFVSIMLTLFLFKETLPPENRGKGRSAAGPFEILRLLTRPTLSIPLILMFAQQLIFFGFESLLGLFLLSRLGILGQGSAAFFLLVGFVLVLVQVRFIGRWSQRYGDRRVIFAALALIASGLLLVATTPEQTHPFYIQRNTAFDLMQQASTDSTEAIIGEMSVELPPDGQRGIAGIIWMFVALIPLSIGSGLIRPSLNSLMTKRVPRQEYGRVLGVSAAIVSAANAAAPLLGGLLFMQFGAQFPFLIGALLMTGLLTISVFLLRPGPESTLSTKPG